MTEDAATPGKWNLGKIVAIAVAGLVVIWVVSQVTESPLDQARNAVGIEHDGGKSISEYNEEQQRNEVLDELNDCPLDDRCGGLDPSGGYNDVPVYPEF
jgi:hypothetical protein